MSVHDYLGGRLPRPNPDAPPRCRVSWRRLEGGAWETLAEVDDEAAARDEVAAPRAPLGPGDLVRLHEDGRAEGLWVATRDGLRDAGKAPDQRPNRLPSPDWVEAWEGERVEAAAMARAAADALVGPARLLAAFGACAALAADGSVEPDSATGRALDLVARAARGEATPDDCREAVRAARAELGEFLRRPGRLPATLSPPARAQMMAEAAVDLAELAAALVGPNPGLPSWSTAGTTAAGDLAVTAVNALAHVRALPDLVDTRAARLDEFPPLFRRHIPLGALLASRAGLPVPDPAP